MSIVFNPCMTMTKFGLVPIQYDVKMDGWITRGRDFWRSGIRNALNDMAHYWMAKYFDKHFSMEGFNEYHYQWRKNPYNTKKRMLNGNIDPIKFGWESTPAFFIDPDYVRKMSIRKVPGSPTYPRIKTRHRITATRDRTTIKMPVPFYIIHHGKGGMDGGHDIDLVSELKSVSSHDMNDLGEFFTKRLEHYTQSNNP